MDDFVWTAIVVDFGRLGGVDGFVWTAIVVNFGLTTIGFGRDFSVAVGGCLLNISFLGFWFCGMG